MTILGKIKKIVSLGLVAAALYLPGCSTNKISLGQDLLSPTPIVEKAEPKPKVTEVEKPEKAKEEEKDPAEVTVFQLYNLKDEYGMTKAQISGKLPGKIDVFGFVEADGKGYFALTTASKKIYKAICAGIEHRSSDGFKDKTHAGLYLKGDLTENGPFVKLKAMQKIGQDSDAKYGILICQDIGDKLSVEALYDRDVRAESFYAEGSLIFKPFTGDFEGLEIILQGRSGGSIHRKDHKDKKFPLDAFVGFSYKF